MVGEESGESRDDLIKRVQAGLRKADHDADSSEVQQCEESLLSILIDKGYEEFLDESFESEGSSVDDPMQQAQSNVRIALSYRMEVKLIVIKKIINDVIGDENMAEFEATHGDVMEQTGFIRQIESFDDPAKEAGQLRAILRAMRETPHDDPDYRDKVLEAASEAVGSDREYWQQIVRDNKFGIDIDGIEGP